MNYILCNIINDLGGIYEEKNGRYIAALFSISETSSSGIERDLALDLALYCEGNENGPLGVISATKLKDEAWIRLSNSG